MTTDIPTTTASLTFTLSLTDEEISSIIWAGDRYCWSAILSRYCVEPGELELTLEDTSEIIKEFKNDMEGGHAAFPCLLRGSSLHKKLLELIEWQQENFV